MFIVRDGKPKGCIVVGQEATEAEHFAAGELRKYIFKITGVSIPILTEIEAEKIQGTKIVCGRTKSSDNYLSEKGNYLQNLSKDGFLLQSFKDVLILKGRRGRGTIYAIYTFLEAKGCRFFEPGSLGEVIPHLRNIEIGGFNEIQNPTFSYREINRACYRETDIIYETEVLDWALKNKLNTIMLVPFHMWDRYLPLISLFPALLREIKRRDLIAGVGGHCMLHALLLPAEYQKPGITLKNNEHYKELYKKMRKQHPDWVKSPMEFADPCLSNKEVVEHLTRMTVLFLENHPAVQLIRFMCEDGFGPKAYCNCPKCGFDLNNPTHLEDVYLQAIGKIAQAVLEFDPKRKIGYTFLSSFGSRPYMGKTKADDLPENMVYYTCLEGQHYIRPIENDKSKFSNPVRITYQGLVEQADNFVKGSGRKFILKEMHGSGYYAGLSRNAPHIIYENTQYYYRCFKETYIGSMVFANLENQNRVLGWHSFGLNFYTYYRLAWDINVDIEKMLKDFFIKYFGASAEFMEEFYKIIEKDATHLIFGAFRHCRRWHGLDSEHSELDELLTSEEKLAFYEHCMETVLKGERLLQEAEAVAEKNHEPSVIFDRLKIEGIAYRYLRDRLSAYLHMYRAGYFYRRSLGIENKETSQLLEKAKGELEKAEVLCNEMRLAGIWGYQQLESIFEMLRLQRSLVDRGYSHE